MDGGVDRHRGGRADRGWDCGLRQAIARRSFVCLELASAYSKSSVVVEKRLSLLIFLRPWFQEIDV